ARKNRFSEWNRSEKIEVVCKIEQDEVFRKEKYNDKSIIHLSRQDMYTPSKNPVKSRKIDTRTPLSTPFCTPNFLKIPDVTVLF
ncbi:MAG: hypothetical protein IKU39_00830, partial [Lachnospiraceae bacterium]|nr:hypothetical protein [Lachnospiraceae bacterium]